MRFLASAMPHFRSRLRMSSRTVQYCLLIILGLTVAHLSGCTSAVEPKPIVEEPTEKFFSSALELGMPVDSDSSDDLILRHFQYTVSYNTRLNVANWVAWNEDSAWYGGAERCDCFEPDPLLPGNIAPVTNAVYSGSGYDRGHIANSEARTRSDSDNHATFYYTNIFPQTASLNRYTWYSLEKYCDSLSTQASKELYIVAGGVYHSNTRLKNLVTIPDSVWKIVVVLDRSQRKSAVNSSTRVIAVMMKNTDYAKEVNDWKLYTTTVREIEQSCGYSFFDSLPLSIQAVLKTKKDLPL